MTSRKCCYGLQGHTERTSPKTYTCPNANHSSLIRNNVVPCICLRVMTYAWSDVTRNAGIRKTNRTTLYVGPRVAGCALCCRVVTYYLYAQESFNLGEWVTLPTGPFYCRWKLSRGDPSHKTYTCQKLYTYVKDAWFSYWYISWAQ